jgi:glycosyltransferase involved in cell wall biosynthesis
MKILIITKNFSPELGGTATFLHEITKRLIQSGHKVTVLSDIAHKKFLSRFWQLFRSISHFDAVYSLDLNSVGIPLMLAAVFRRKKYALRISHDDAWEQYLENSLAPLTLSDFYGKGIHKQPWLTYRLITLVLRMAERVVFNSEELRDLYQTHYGVSERKTSVIYAGAPVYKFGGLVSSYKQQAIERDREIVFAGRFIKMKNVESLIKAFARLEDSTFKLLLIGDGLQKQVLHALVSDLKIADQVEFLPPMSQALLYRRIANAYLVVIPSWTDCATQQVVECLAMNIPLLLTRERFGPACTMPIEAIDPASINDIHERLSNLLDPNVYQKYQHILQNIKYSYSWDKVVIEHLKVYKMLI